MRSFARSGGRSSRFVSTFSLPLSSVYRTVTYPARASIEHPLDEEMMGLSGRGGR